MTITIRPIHFVVVLAFIMGIGTAWVVFGSNGGVEQTTQIQPTPTPERFADVAPTETPPPTPPPPPLPTPEPPPPPTEVPAPTAAPPVQQARPATAVPPPSNPPPRAAAPPAEPPAPQGPTPEELSYRNRATAQLFALITQLQQSRGNITRGATNSILDLAGIARNFAGAVQSISPVPPRFQQAHNNIVTAHINLANYCQTIVNANLTSVAAIDAWFDRLQALFILADRSIDDYNLVVGISLPRLNP